MGSTSHMEKFTIQSKLITKIVFQVTIATLLELALLTVKQDSLSSISQSITQLSTTFLISLPL